MKPILWRVAIRDSELDPRAKLVAYTLSTYMNGEGDCWPAKQTIADCTGISKRGVDYAIGRLQAAGFLAIRRSKGRHRNHYFASTLQTAAGLNRADPDTNRAGSCTSTVQTAAPEVVYEVVKEEVGEPAALSRERRLPIKDECMRCMERRTLYFYRARWLCKDCILAVTGELEAELRSHVEDLALKVKSA